MPGQPTAMAALPRAISCYDVHASAESVVTLPARAMTFARALLCGAVVALLLARVVGHIPVYAGSHRALPLRRVCPTRRRPVVSEITTVSTQPTQQVHDTDTARYA